MIDFDDFDRRLEPGWGRRRRWPGVLRTLLAVVAVAVIGVVVVPKYVGLVADQADRNGTANGGAAPDGPAGPAAPEAEDPRPAAEQLLRQRADALLRRDKAAFLAVLDPRARAFRSQQARLFDRLGEVPLAAYEYRLASARDGALDATRATFAPDPVYAPLAESRYRFRAEESSPVLNTVRFVFVRTPEGWRIGGQEKPRDNDHHHTELWDTGAVAVLRSERTLVLHHPAGGRLAQQLLEAADAGFDDVDAAWDGDWDHRVVIMVPHSEAEAEKVAGVADISSAAAVAATSIETGTKDVVLAARIVVNPSIRRYDPLNRQVVVTHEMTHVATRAVGTAVPLFLVEGFADYAALRGVDLPLRSTRPTLAEVVRDGEFDRKLPTERVFDLKGADDRSRSLAYDEGSTFCLWVERTYGLEALRALYRSFGDHAGRASGELVDQKVSEVLGVSFDTAESRWADFVEDTF